MPVPTPNLWKARREVFLVSWPEEDDMEFTPMCFSDLQAGDYFTLEAADEIDPLHGVPAVDRMFLARSDPFSVDGVLQLECERV